MVAPRRSGKIDGLGVGEETTQESTTNTKGTSSRDGLSHSNLDGFVHALIARKIQRVHSTYGVSVQRCALSTICKLDSSLGEVSETSDGKVLVVWVRVPDNFLGLLDGTEHVWLAILVTVSTDAQVDLARILVGLEGFGNTYSDIVHSQQSLPKFVCV